MSNLPHWPGAEGAYARANRITAAMAHQGHVEIVRRGGRPVRSIPSPELRDFIDALGRGDEERIKALNYQYAAFDRPVAAATTTLKAA